MPGSTLHLGARTPTRVAALVVLLLSACSEGDAGARDTPADAPPGMGFLTDAELMGIPRGEVLLTLP